MTVFDLPWATTGTSGSGKVSSTSRRSGRTSPPRFPCSRVPQSRYRSDGTQVTPDWEWERSPEGCTTRICKCSSGARNVAAKTGFRAASRSDSTISPDTSGMADILMDGTLCSHHNRGFTIVIGWASAPTATVPISEFGGGATVPNSGNAGVAPGRFPPLR